METEKRLLNTEEAAELIGVAPPTLADWRLKGRGPAFIKHSPTATILYERAVIERYMAAVTTVPGLG